MAECPDTVCGDYTLSEWAALSPKEQWFYIFCALQSAASGGNPELIGVYTVTTDANYVAPADASLIIWNVPGQTQDRFIDFTGTAGQETQVLVLDSGAFSVGDAFTLGSVFYLNANAPYVVNVRVVNQGTGEIVPSDGTAAQYNVGSGTGNIPTVAIADARYVTLATTQTVTGAKDFSALTTLSGGVNGKLTVKGANSTNPTGLTETQFQIYKSSAGQFLNQVFYVHGAALDQKIWDIITADDGNFGFRAVNDAYNNANNAFRLTRVGFIPSIQLIPEGGGTCTVGPTASNTPVRGKRLGLATMAAGTTGAIADATITAGSVINLSPGFAPAGRLYYTKTAGVGFTILSTDAGDAGEVSWERTIL